MRITRGTYVAVLSGALAWCSLFLLAPLSCAASGDAGGVGGAIYRALHLVCHQIPERSLHLLGWPLAVCVRCSAIYVGFLAGVLLYPLLRNIDRPALPGRALLLAAALPLLVDGLDIGFFFYDVTNTTRALTGAPFGLVLPFIIVPAAQEAALELLAGASPLPHKKGLSDA